MAIKIEMLRCFVTVAQTGNLTDAATRLGKTQSAISMTLKLLEENLGKRLFESDRKNRLTPLGAHVFELAQTQLRQFDYTVKAIQSSANSPQGLIRIASIPSVASLVFPATIETLTKRNPGLRIELRDSDTQQVIDALLRGQADIGIVSGKHSLNGIRQAHLFSDQFGLICAPTHPLARQKQRPTIRDISTVNFITNALSSLIKNPSFHSATIGSKLAVHNTMSLIAMVRTGRWVTVLPKTVIKIENSELIYREIADLPEQRQVFLLMRERTPFPQFSEEIWQYLTQFNWDQLTQIDAGEI